MMFGSDEFGDYVGELQMATLIHVQANAEGRHLPQVELAAQLAEAQKVSPVGVSEKTSCNVWQIDSQREPLLCQHLFAQDFTCRAVSMGGRGSCECVSQHWLDLPLGGPRTHHGLMPMGDSFTLLIHG